LVSTQLDSYFGIIEERVPPEGYTQGRFFYVRLGVLTIVGSDVLLLDMIYNQTKWVKQCLMTSSLMIG
jgi:hypothetical protein